MFRQLWTDAGKAFLGHAVREPGVPSAAEALCKAGLCRLKARDETGSCPCRKFCAAA
jgi:hypothetical protein